MMQRQSGLTRRAVLKRVAGGVVALALAPAVAACGGGAATTGVTTSTRTLAMPTSTSSAATTSAQPTSRLTNSTLMAKATAYGYWPTPGSIQIGAAFNEPWGGLIAGKTDPKTALAEMKQAVQTEMDKYQA